MKYLKEVHKWALALWNKYNQLMSVGESAYLENFINARDVPVPRLIIKDHKKKKANGQYPLRLLIPATKFTQYVAKLGFDVVKSVFDCNDVPYKTYIINRAQILKSDVERIDRNATIKKNKYLFAFLDIENMYPSITFWLINKAVRYYSETHVKDEGDLAAIEIGLEMLQFSIANCLIIFQEKYYHYGKQDNPWMCVLAIGGYYSAWLADLVACYILDMTESSWKPVFNYFKIYRNDGVGLARNSSVKKLTKWFEEFQNKVNVLTDNTIKFTMDI